MSSRILRTRAEQYKCSHTDIFIKQELTEDIEKSTTLHYCPEQEVYLVKHILIGCSYDPEDAYFATLPRDELANWLRRKYDKGSMIEILVREDPYPLYMYRNCDAHITNLSDFETVITEINEHLHTLYHKESTS